MGLVTVEALRGVTFDIHAGDYISIMGPSGCGKSTLLNLLGCLDRPTSGRYLLGGEDVSQMNDDALSAVRGARLGFVFQSYNLIQQLTVVENIEIPLYYQGRPEAGEPRDGAEAGRARRAWTTGSTTNPPSSPAASSSASPSPARWSTIRSSSWPTNRPAISIPPPARKS